MSAAWHETFARMRAATARDQHERWAMIGVTQTKDRVVLSRHFVQAAEPYADQPYERLKRALRAEIDEAAWSSLYATQSQPFDAPKPKKIAVKVINHYGDEVLKVFAV